MATFHAHQTCFLSTQVTYASFYEHILTKTFTLFVRFPQIFWRNIVETKKMLLKKKHERKLGTGFCDIKNINTCTNEISLVNVGVI